MPDLIAQGPLPEHRWRRKLQDGARHVIGRQAGPWSTPWDDRISRRHVEIAYDGGRLLVETIAGARNPVFYRGYKTEQFSLRPGDHFVIGQTTFTLVEERADASLDLPQPADERTFTLDELRRHAFRQADKRIDVLSRLPDMISGSATDQELFVRLVNLLLTGIERASAAAVVAVKAATSGRGEGEAPAEPKDHESGVRSQGTGDRGQETGDRQGIQPVPGTHYPALSRTTPTTNVSVLHWDRRILAGTDFRPSQRLILQAVESGESVAHVWSTGARSQEPGASGQPPAAFTVSEGVDWAFCTPVSGRACAGWALYVTGSFGPDLPAAGADELRDEVKFAELTASTLNALRESRLLASRQASLSQFFSPVVLETLASRDADEALAPREADVTVLFCDLRGFTRQSERAAGDLFGLLSRVSQALGVMTHHILQQGGVVGDFHGDAAMGFWGWPLPQPDAVERACRAALGIRQDFSAAAGLADFHVGIGIASGRAVAGKIGTVDQVKVTVFGPVVNLASRLETMTRQLRASILLDPPTAAVIRATIPRDICRVRRLAKILPVGLAAPLEVSELLPPLLLGEGRGEGHLTDADLTAYEAALDAFQSRDWPLALKHLHAVPPDDQAKDFLTIFIAQHNRTPPLNWDGAIPLEAK